MLAEQGLPRRQANHFYFPIANDDDEVIDLRFEGAVHTAIQAEVPSDKHVHPSAAASDSTEINCQEESGKGQPRS